MSYGQKQEGVGPEGPRWKRQTQREGAEGQSLGVGAGLRTQRRVRSSLTSSLMILREGVNSLLMKFAEDIKLEGVVNTNEDSKAVRRDLEGRTLAGDLDHGGGGRGWVLASI